jgi:sugar phosphate isomerase/epimerase
MTIRPGLCSVTLRGRSIDDVVRLAAECRLEAIEWGGDGHVPPTDVAASTRARAASTAAGLDVASYGSYAFAAGIPDDEETAALLDTALALGAPSVRVWAGFGTEAGTAAYTALVAGLQTFTRAAAVRELAVALEFHGGTPTATVAGTLALLDVVAAPNLTTYWQPPYWRGATTPGADAAEVIALGSHLSHLHVYEWAGPEQRLPLEAGEERWRAVLAAAGSIERQDRIAFLEFVGGDDPDALRRDARTLRAWLGSDISAANQGPWA